MIRKIALAVLAVIIGVPLLLFGVYWLLGSSAERRAYTIDSTPSPNLVALATTYQIQPPNRPSVDCNQFIEGGVNPTMGAWGTSMRFVSWVNDARSAESAAAQYSASGNSKMAAVATADAIDRWQHALHEKSELDCLETEKNRESY